MPTKYFLHYHSTLQRGFGTAIETVPKWLSNHLLGPTTEPINYSIYYYDWKHNGTPPKKRHNFFLTSSQQCAGIDCNPFDVRVGLAHSKIKIK